VNAAHAVPAEFRLYEPLVLDGNADDDETAEDGENVHPFLSRLNPNSLEILHGFVEPGLKEAKPQDKFQFFRHGYFNVDPKDTGNGRLVFNRIVSLKSSYELPR